MKRTKIDIYDFLLTLILGLFSLVCVLPVILVLIASFSSNESLTEKGFSFFPSGWSLDGWKYVFDFGSQLVTSYQVTIFITITGTVLAIIIMSMFAYVLTRKKFPLRTLFTLLLILTMMFDGGQVSKYIMYVGVYRLKDTLAVLIFPTCVTAMNVIIIRSFISANVPDALCEAATIDGAGDFRVFWQIVFPILKPVVAAVGFMKAVEIWNEWQNAYLFISSNDKTPLQLLLIQIEKNIEYALNNTSDYSPQEYYELMTTLPQDSCRMAMLFMVLGPILFLYPFFQKYFVKGLTVGAVK